MIETAVILAAGLGGRLNGLAGDIPKGFIEKQKITVLCYIPVK